jgi:hypothetical protein
VKWIAEHRAEVKALNAEINEEYMVADGQRRPRLQDRRFQRDLPRIAAGVEDRDELLDCIREGFAALGIGQVVDWVDAAQRTPRGSNGTAPPDDAARAWGRSDGAGGVHDHAGDYPSGYSATRITCSGWPTAKPERDRIMGLGRAATVRADGAGEAAPREWPRPAPETARRGRSGGVANGSSVKYMDLEHSKTSPPTLPPRPR